MKNATECWKSLLREILISGQHVQTRALLSIEKIAMTTTWPMRDPVILSKTRKLGYHFMNAEAAWILSGDNRVETILPYSKRIAEFSDDGIFFFGSYGPPIIMQLPYVVDTLLRDVFSRQAVMTIWRQSPPRTRDVPCTVALQFIVRENQLNCIATMRSSDAWLGVPYDVFNFSMISRMVLLYLRQIQDVVNDASQLNWYNVDVGSLYLTAGSQHIYSNNLTDASGLVDSDSVLSEMPFSIDQLQIDKLNEPSDLVEQLWRNAKKVAR